jgi:hypothetical protein
MADHWEYLDLSFIEEGQRWTLRFSDGQDPALFRGVAQVHPCREQASPGHRYVCFEVEPDPGRVWLPAFIGMLAREGWELLTVLATSMTRREYYFRRLMPIPLPAPPAS